MRQPAGPRVPEGRARGRGVQVLNIQPLSQVCPQQARGEVIWSQCIYTFNMTMMSDFETVWKVLTEELLKYMFFLIGWWLFIVLEDRWFMYLPGPQTGATLRYCIALLWFDKCDDPGSVHDFCSLLFEFYDVASVRHPAAENTCKAHPRPAEKVPQVFKKIVWL